MNKARFYFQCFYTSVKIKKNYFTDIILTLKKYIF